MEGLPRRVPPILSTTPQPRGRVDSFTGDFGSQGLIRRDLNAYLERVPSTLHSSSEQDFSKLNKVQFLKFAQGVHQELTRRNMVTGVSRPSSSQGDVDRKGVPNHFAHLSSANFIALVRDVFNELSKRCPVTPTSPTISVRSSQPVFRPRGDEAPQARAESAIPFGQPIQPPPRSSTSDINDLRNTRRLIPLTRRISYIGSPLKHSNAPYRSHSPRDPPNLFLRDSPRTPISPLASDSEPSTDLGAESEDYLADDARSTRESTIQRLQKISTNQQNTIRDQERMIKDLQERLDRAERTVDSLSEERTSLETYAEMLKQENRTLSKMLTERSQELAKMETKTCVWVPSADQWQGIVDPRMGSFLRDACHSELHKELMLSARGDLAKRILHAVQEVLDRKVFTSGPIGLEHRNVLRRLLVRLSRESNVLPERLLVGHIDCTNKDPVSGGHFADIYGAKYRGERVALKRLRSFQLKKSDNVQDLLREAIVWNQLEHPHILPFYGVDLQTFTSQICMVSPWMSHGNVYDAMETLRRWGHVIPYMLWVLQLAKGLGYLHSENVVHGDVRGANVLIDTDMQVRVGDFGLAFFADTSTFSLGSHVGGAARWMAPELLKSTIPRPNQTCDIYAFGSTCVEIYAGRPPFSNIIHDAQVVYQVQQGTRPCRPDSSTAMAMPDYLWEIVQRCWADDPSERPPMSLIVSELESHLEAEI